MARPSILYVTDLTYPARGRRYGDEDTHLSAALRTDFAVALCHPLDAAGLMDSFDGVVVRNSGPVLHYQEQYDAFRAEALQRGTRVFNELTGRADMAGKQYLLDLSAGGHPVIPTAEAPGDLDRLPDVAAYVAKPKLGADSIGLEIVGPDRIAAIAAAGGMLLQPRIDFRYEVSFYFVDREFQYALYTPDKDVRWQLAPYRPSPADLAFARHFVDWNTIDHGIQRVDACRTADGELLLVELEDLNPYLSLDLLEDGQRESFTAAVKDSLHRLLRR
ncbi:hypothetical protein [Kitasatospora sp. DSM 101779]|uniref:hypothetical protein n=1 Tax=Kitasatospora sp. DSM 101779 TaxID=2853165 RepID=UPI0021D9929F|nr:hypothetical protein [Kitasatospora sp. DSM 101779]MCU7824645.1 hypothetical protein [Kitasatospora sp. DSM 101779]